MIPGDVSPVLAGWTVVSLRPAPQLEAVRAAVQARGAAFVGLPGLALEPLPADRGELDVAYRCKWVVFTSPAAVQFAHAACAIPPATAAIAVGSGTARALAECGLRALHPPDEAMRSEGVLAMPVLQGPGEGAGVGVITAPGGRELIAPALRERGFAVRVVPVYRRTAPAWTAGETDKLACARAPLAVLLTSAEALANALDALPAPLRENLLAATAVASSERLAQRAREAGFARTLAAASPRTESLLDALAAHAKGTAIR